MQIIKYLQLPFSFDPNRMLEEVNNITSICWQPHYQVKHYDGNWSAIPLRSIDGKTDHIIVSPDDNNYMDTQFLTNSPYLQQVLNNFKCRLQSVRLLKLNAGSSIKQHRDAELNYEKGEIRLHIPVFTHPEVEFFLDGEKLELKEGECWYMNFNLLHSIANKSKIDRVHLVIDAEVNEWVRDLFNSDQIKNKKEIEDASGHLDHSTKLQMIHHLKKMNTQTSMAMALEMEKSLQ